MISFLQVSEITLSILLIFIVLIQNKQTSLNLTTMGGGMSEITRRGPEKILHNTTIVLGVLWTLNSILLFILK